MVTPTAPSARGPTAFAVICCELILLLCVVQRFDIEGTKHFFPLLCLTGAGFALHAWLPRRCQLWFFALLSLTGILFMLGWLNGGLVIGIGSGLIALVLMPVHLAIRALLLVGAGLLLATYRIQFPGPFWAVLGSMFMFRIIVYLFEVRQESQRPPLAQLLAYFFPLPNASFPLFPVVDFRTFRETYYGRDDWEIYQTGIAWMVRGLTHLLLYRIVKYYLIPAPYEVRDLPHLALFLAMNYALYLHVSGWFHLITGMLHLFGFDLPRTHNNYFLASSFGDFWRRINIYWKDFMMKVFFFPAFFALRGQATGRALAAATLWVFIATWLLHSYQMFWLTGGIALTWNEAALWLIAGVLVAVNLQSEVSRSRQAAAQALKKDKSLWQMTKLALRTVTMFNLISFFWACWTIPRFLAYLRPPSEMEPGALPGVLAMVAVILAAVAAGVLAQWVHQQLVRCQLLPWTPSFTQAAFLHTGLLGAVLVATSSQVTARLSPGAAEFARVMQLDSYSPAEVALVVRGYYEQIAETRVHAGPLLGELSGEDPALRAERLQYIEMTRPVDDLLERELIPGWKGTLAGNSVTINRLGMRDREDVSQDRAPNTCRIALVGSSVVMGYGVGDEEVFKYLLEEKLNGAKAADGPGIELLNFGTGMSDAIHRRVLIERKVFPFKPDAIYYFAHQEEMLFPPRHLARLVAHGTNLPYPCLADVVRKAGIRQASSERGMEQRLMPLGREIVSCVYRSLAEECRRQGILPVWIYVPIPGIVEVPARSADLLNLAGESGFVVLNLADWSDGFAPAEVKLGEREYHLNPAGHRILAARLFAAIRERPELLPCPGRQGF
jgi:hypothetical protein